MQQQLALLREAAQRQDELDRRWRNIYSHYGALQEARTIADHLSIVNRYGMTLLLPDGVDITKKLTHAEFMQLGYKWNTLDKFEGENEPDAVPICDYCKTNAGKSRCSECGEWYCSIGCFRKALKDHKAVCENMAWTGQPQKLLSAESYADFWLDGRRYSFQKVEQVTNKEEEAAAEIDSQINEWLPPELQHPRVQKSKKAGNKKKKSHKKGGH